MVPPAVDMLFWIGLYIGSRPRRRVRVVVFESYKYFFLASRRSIARVDHFDSLNSFETLLEPHEVEQCLLLSRRVLLAKLCRYGVHNRQLSISYIGSVRSCSLIELPSSKMDCGLRHLPSPLVQMQSNGRIQPQSMLSFDSQVDDRRIERDE